MHPKQVEYLAEAWRIAHYQGNNRYVAMSDIADEMKVTAPAVTRMVQRLQESGYVIHEPYRGILLTETGERESVAVHPQTSDCRAVSGGCDEI
ncbi:MAG UNVERIFIED_CONTAM: MarR family transcriptional regulator [Anaerolineae bacterium]